MFTVNENVCNKTNVQSYCEKSPFSSSLEELHSNVTKIFDFFDFTLVMLFLTRLFNAKSFSGRMGLDGYIEHFLVFRKKHNTKKLHWKPKNKMEKQFSMFHLAKTHPLNY